MTLPLPALPTVPAKRRCRRCGHPVPTGRLYDGMGEACAVMVGLLVRRPRWPVVHGEAAATDSTLFDTFNINKEIQMPGPRFRAKPVEVEAVHFTGDNLDEVATFLGAPHQARVEAAKLPGPGRGVHDGIKIHTLGGVIGASVDDWIVRDAQGELKPCKPDVFEATYEPVNA